jgi:hypothetical protein
MIGSAKAKTNQGQPESKVEIMEQENPRLKSWAHTPYGEPSFRGPDRAFLELRRLGMAFGTTMALRGNKRSLRFGRNDGMRLIQGTSTGSS